MCSAISYSNKKDIALGTKNGIIMIFNILTKKCNSIWTKDFKTMGSVISIDYSRDASRIVVGYEFGVVKIFDTSYY